MLAKDVMNEGVVSIAAEATVLEAAVLLANCRVSAMPVLDKDGVMLGIVSEADLLPFAGLEATVTAGLPDAARNRRVAEIMTRDVITVEANAPLKDVVVLMAGKRVKRLPVRSGQSIVGIISRVDLMRVIAARATTAEAASATYDSDDAALRRAVLAAVQGQSWSTAQHFDVVVIAGTIHLWGIVSNRQALDSYRNSAKNLPGAKAVVSHMQVMRHGIHPVGGD